MIRPYADSDWGDVCTVYDLSKPDEMAGIVDASVIAPLADDEKMRPYFFASDIWVYEEGGRVVGFVGLKQDVVSWLFVHPEHRRKGIARALLTYVIETRDGPLRLSLTRPNRTARTLYESLGFEVTEEFEGKMWGRAIPAMRMVLKRDESGE